MKIVELFDQPQPIQWNTSAGEHGIITAEFVIDNTIFEISFEPGITDELGFEPDEDGLEWSVTFGVEGKSHYYNARKDPGSTSKDFKHKTVLVFSTVVSAIDEFFKQKNPDAVYLAASSDRQEKMYVKLVKYFNSTKSEYHIRTHYNTRDGEYYEITK